MQANHNSLLSSIALCNEWAEMLPPLLLLLL
jgi:hypothetical protein